MTIKILNERGEAMLAQRESIARLWANHPCPESTPLVVGDGLFYFCYINATGCLLYDLGKPCEIYDEFIKKVREEM